MIHMHPPRIRAIASHLTHYSLTLALWLPLTTFIQGQTPPATPTGRQAGVTSAKPASGWAPLAPGQAVEQLIRGGETHTYAVKLWQGEFLRVVAASKDVDVAATLYGPDGAKLLVADLLKYPGPEPLSFVAEREGAYRLEVSASEPEAVSGHYVLTSETKAGPSDSDKERLAAEGALREAAALVGDGSKELQARAVQKCAEAVRRWRARGNKFWEAFALHCSGRAYGNRGEYQKALEFFDQALAIRRTLGDRAGESATLNNMGRMFYVRDEKRKALEFYSLALPLERATGVRYGEVFTLTNMGTAYGEIGELQKTLECFNRALQLERSFGDRKRESATLNDIGAAYNILGEKRKALEFFNLALPLERAIGDRATEAVTLTNIGNAYNSLGEREKALEFYNLALPLERAAGDRYNEAFTLNNIGIVYNDLGEKQKALEFYNLALPLRRAVGDRSGEADALNNIAIVYSDSGEKQKALEVLNQVLVLRRALDDRGGESGALTNIGAVYQDLGDKQKALEFFNLALPLERAVGLRGGEADTLTNIGAVYNSLGEKRKALELYNHVLGLQRAIGNRSGEARTLRSLMDFCGDNGKLSLAIFYGKQAINDYQQLRTNIQGLDRKIQKTYLQTVADHYRDLADLLITSNRLPEAQQVLAMLKEEEYFDFVRRDGAEANTLTARATLTAEEAALEAEYNRIADEVTLLGKQRGDLSARRERTAAEEQQLNRLEDQLATANDHFQKFLEQLQVKFGSTTAQAARVADVKDALGMQKTLRELGDGAVLLYTLVGADKYRVMLVTPDTQQAYENPIKAVELQRKVLAFRLALQDPRTDCAPLARELYGILIGPKLAHDLKQSGAKTLMWSLDGVLRYLPVAALQDEHQKYLVETYRNAIFTPASRDRLKDPVAAHWQGLGLGVSKGKNVVLPDTGRKLSFNALPGVSRELHSIIRDKAAEQATVNSEGVLEGRVMLDDSFTKDALRTALRQQYPLVHIASHFMFQPGNETDSFLLLGGTDEQNNKLTIAELKRLSFEGVNLLTLSACETAMSGEKANGVEVESFGVLAQRQGADAVMATLWPVADLSTPLLMREFYRLRESNPGMTKAEALRRAQVALLTGEIKPPQSGKDNRGLLTGVKLTKASFAHPFYWAPFILIGNWK